MAEVFYPAQRYGLRDIVETKVDQRGDCSDIMEKHGNTIPRDVFPETVALPVSCTIDLYISVFGLNFFPLIKG